MPAAPPIRPERTSHDRRRARAHHPADRREDPELSADQIIEALSPGDDLGDDSGIPPHIASQVLDVIAMLADRMDEMESRLTPGRLN